MSDASPDPSSGYLYHKQDCPYCGKIIWVAFVDTDTFTYQDISPVEINAKWVYNKFGKYVDRLSLVYIQGTCKSCQNQIRLPVLFDMKKELFIPYDQPERKEEPRKYVS